MATTQTRAQILEARLARSNSIAKARNHFSALGTYERGQLAALGTAFTTYEDLGEVYCAELNRLAKAWRS